MLFSLTTRAWLLLFGLLLHSVLGFPRDRRRANRYFDMSLRDHNFQVYIYGWDTELVTIDVYVVPEEPEYTLPEMTVKIHPRRSELEASYIRNRRNEMETMDLAKILLVLWQEAGQPARSLRFITWPDIPSNAAQVADHDFHTRTMQRDIQKIRQRIYQASPGDFIIRPPYRAQRSYKDILAWPALSMSIFYQMALRMGTKERMSVRSITVRHRSDNARPGTWRDTLTVKLGPIFESTACAVCSLPVPEDFSATLKPCNRAMHVQCAVDGLLSSSNGDDCAPCFGGATGIDFPEPEGATTPTPDDTSTSDPPVGGGREPPDTCVICHDAMSEDQPATMKPCKHMTHLRCALEWYASPYSRGKCAYCRGNIKSMDFPHAKVGISSPGEASTSKPSGDTAERTRSDSDPGSP